jgi:hypothetical protein
MPWATPWRAPSAWDNAVEGCSPAGVRRGATRPPRLRLRGPGSLMPVLARRRGVDASRLPGCAQARVPKTRRSAVRRARTRAWRSFVTSALERGSNFLLPSYVLVMRTTKISIAIDKQLLRLARRAAASEGSSLSAYIGRALGRQLEAQERTEAARELYRSWGSGTVPSAADWEDFRRAMTRPRKRRRKAA